MKTCFLLSILSLAVLTTVPETLTLNSVNKIPPSETDKTFKYYLSTDAPSDLTIEITNKTKVLHILHITFEEDRTVEWIYGQVDNEVIVVPKKYLNKDKTIIINYHCELCESSLKIYFASAVLEIGQAKFSRFARRTSCPLTCETFRYLIRT